MTNKTDLNKYQHGDHTLLQYTDWGHWRHLEVSRGVASIIPVFTGFPVFFKPYNSRFFPGKKGHSPGFCVDNFSTKKADAKDILKLQEQKTLKKKCLYNIEMFILTI